jgi:hypothetical protein
MNRLVYGKATIIVFHFIKSKKGCMLSFVESNYNIYSSDKEHPCINQYIKTIELSSNILTFLGYFSIKIIQFCYNLLVAVGQMYL